MIRRLMVASIMASFALAGCQTQKQADVPFDAESFNRAVFACNTGIGAHGLPAPRALLHMAIRHKMPDPDNAIATVFTSRCSDMTTKFFFCAAGATVGRGGHVSGKTFFYGRYTNGDVKMISRGKEAERDCRAMDNGDNDI